ncbi:MAG: Holliday junction resolvase RuvX [Aquificae bacterium]|nr:Holliday junction resolvase RuvX [Aquificota bacterium]
MKKRKIALDIGDKRIGVAVSDPFGISITPLEPIQNTKEAFEKIKSLVEEYDVDTVVVGLPLTLKGEEGEQAKKVRKFVNKLQEYIPNIPIQFIDERFTTSLANQHLKQTTKKSKRKQKVDSLSAVYILKTYLERPNTV